MAKTIGFNGYFLACKEKELVYLVGFSLTWLNKLKSVKSFSQCKSGGDLRAYHEQENHYNGVEKIKRTRDPNF